MSTHQAEPGDRDAIDDRVSAETRELVTFLCELPTSQIPAEVLHESKRCLLDFFGVAVGAAHEEAPSIVGRQLALLGGNPQAAVLGTGSRLRVTDAALVNGIAAHVFDFDDTHIPTILHPTTPMYAAGLALAEWRGRPGVELLAAHALGYELSARVSVALYPEHYDIGWHMTGTTGTLAAVTASSRLLGLSPGVMTHALGLATTQAAGHREQFGAMTKSFHAGHAAEGGLLSALLADDGYVAAPDSLQGRRGMFSVMSTRATPADLVEGLGQKWEIFRNGIKPYACGVVTHPPIDTVRLLARDHAVRPEEVVDITIQVHPLVAELTGKTNPLTALEGKFSVQFACSIALLEGTARERQFSDANVHRPDVRSLMSRITVVPSPDVPHEAAIATARLTDGREVVVRVDAATGTPENRISDEELLEKFHDLVDPVLGAQQADALAEGVWSVDRAATVDELVALAVPAGA
jgi:2-methylcitrate dehydratase PrpD